MIPELIAHRGEPGSWPENSLAGYAAVLAAGARYVETDVQVTADGIAVLSHDPSTLRITGHDLAIPQAAWADLRDLPAGQAERFDARYADLRLARLEDFAALLAGHPAATAFIEIKPASIEAHGVAAVVDLALARLEGVLAQCVLISFDPAALEHGREHHRLPVGWVLPEWNADNRRRAGALQPDYLFCNRKRLPPEDEPLWPGPWRWVVYTINEAAEVLDFGRRGAALVETNVIRRLLADPLLAAGTHG